MWQVAVATPQVIRARPDRRKVRLLVVRGCDWHAIRATLERWVAGCEGAGLAGRRSPPPANTWPGGNQSPWIAFLLPLTANDEARRKATGGLADVVPECSRPPRYLPR